MVSLSIKNIRAEKFKVSLSVMGVALSIFLIFILFGLISGLGYVIELPIRETEADLWVTTKDSFGSLHSPSLLPISMEENLSRIEGVKVVQPLIRIPVTKDLDGIKYLLYIMAYNNSNGIGGPWKPIAPAPSTLNTGDIIVDISLAKKVGFKIGDKLEIGETIFNIVGFNEDSSMLIAFSIFMNLEDAQQFLPEGITSFYVVQIADGFTVETVKSNIQSSLDVSAIESDAMARQYRSELLDGFTPILAVIAFIGLFVSVLVISMTIYSLTLEKIKDYAILKAFGASNFYLFRIVLEQSIIISGIAIIFSNIIVQPIVYIIRELVPEFIVLVEFDLLLATSVLSLFTALIASFIPLRKLMSIDPVIVFK